MLLIEYMKGLPDDMRVSIVDHNAKRICCGENRNVRSQLQFEEKHTSEFSVDYEVVVRLKYKTKD